MVDTPIDPRSTDLVSRFGLPYPLAALYRLSRASHEASDRFGFSLRLTEGVLRFLALVNLADAMSCGATQKTVQEWLQCLEMPGMGKLLALFRSTAKFLSEDGREPFLSEGGLLTESDWHTSAKAVIELRNRWTHDEVQITNLEAAPLLQELEPHLRSLLSGIQSLAHYRLGTAQGLRSAGKGFVYYWYSSRGMEETCEPVKIRAETPLPDGIPFLLDPKRGRALNLAPVFFWGLTRGDRAAHLSWLLSIERQPDGGQLGRFRHPVLRQDVVRGFTDPLDPEPDGPGLPVKDFLTRIGAYEGRFDLKLSADAHALLEDATRSPTFAERYTLIGKLGQGGMGTVWAVEDTALGCRRALKQLHPAFVNSQQALRRFQREGKLLAQIDHPGVVKVHHIDLDPDHVPYLVMELIEGEDLQQRVDREGPLAISEAVQILLQTLEALEAIHACKVIHRDIKPSNLLFSNGRVRVVDFGIAMLPDGTHLTRSMDVMGSLHYMAPEQLHGQFSPQSDVFSCGRVLFFLLTGRCPAHPGESLRAANPSVSRALDQIHATATDLSAANRYPSAQAMREAFRASLEVLIELLIYEKIAADRPPQLVATLVLPGGRTELGRQKTTDEALYAVTREPESKLHRIVVARGTEQTIGRVHLLLEPLLDGRLQATNIGSRSTVTVDGGPELVHSVPYQCEITPGVVFRLGASRIIRVQQKSVLTEDASSLGDAEVGFLPTRTLGPGGASTSLAQSRSLPLRLPESDFNSDVFMEWLQSALELLQSATAATDFFKCAAQAMVDLAGLDSGRVLLCSALGWSERALASADPRRDTGWSPSLRILDRVREEKRTFWELPMMTGRTGTTTGVKLMVAAPILDRAGEVIGVLHGERWGPDRPLSRIEAVLVQLLACGVAARLARQKEEEAMLRFESFFTPQLAHHLAANPEMLDGRIAEVTVLFCDVRGFARFSHRLPPATLVKWIGDVMEVLSECVIEQQGVLVDFIGDELMAMWGAPDDQPDHALRACQAGLAMLDALPRLNENWQAILGESMNLGIGLNSGQAHVGNIGTPRKFKYGPLGSTVNLASRVQGMSRHLKAQFLLTEDTGKEIVRLEAALAERIRRVCRARVVNIDSPVTLYEVRRPDYAGDAHEWKAAYEQALEHFDAQNFRLAIRSLNPLMSEAINDGPSMVLAARAMQAIAGGPPAEHPVWDGVER